MGPAGSVCLRSGSTVNGSRWHPLSAHLAPIAWGPAGLLKRPPPLPDVLGAFPGWSSPGKWLRAIATPRRVGASRDARQDPAPAPSHAWKRGEGRRLGTTPKDPIIWKGWWAPIQPSTTLKPGSSIPWCIPNTHPTSNYPLWVRCGTGEDITYLNQNHLFSRVQGAGLWAAESINISSKQGFIQFSAIARCTGPAKALPNW